jgi:hypothetical protein
MTSPLRFLAALLLCAVAAVAQVRDQREATVGMRAYVEQVVLEGSELVAAPTTIQAPVLVRILRTFAHGDHLRYDLEWVGFEEGTYDLTDYLVRKDGSSTDGLPDVEVEVVSVLPGDMFEPSEIDPEQGQRLGGYSALQVVVTVIWVAGLLAILFFGRKRKVRVEAAPPKPTLADRLRPLVERVTSGDAEEAQKAELERLLVAFWRARLDLGDLKVADAVMAIRRDDEAGKLLRHIETWLHAPEPPKDVDLGKLLEPYRSVTADQFQPEAR